MPSSRWPSRVKRVAGCPKDSGRRPRHKTPTGRQPFVGGKGDVYPLAAAEYARRSRHPCLRSLRPHRTPHPHGEVPWEATETCHEQKGKDEPRLRSGFIGRQIRGVRSLLPRKGKRAASRRKAKHAFGLEGCAASKIRIIPMEKLPIRPINFQYPEFQAVGR